MTPKEAVEALVAVLGVGAFLAVFYGPWQAVCIEFARQRMFEARDAVFDLAREGRLEFSDPTYREVRLGIERLIRFAHHITPFKLIAYAMFVRLENDERTQARDPYQLQQSIADKETRRLASRQVRKALEAAVLLFMLRSLVLTALLVVALLVGWPISRVWKGIGYPVHVAGSALGRVIQADAERDDGKFASA